MSPAPQGRRPPRRHPPRIHHSPGYASLAQRLLAERPRVVRLATRILGDEMEAEDVAQEVLLAALDALPRFRGQARLTTWLHRIAVNRALNRRAHLIRRDSAAHAACAEPGPAVQPDPEHEASRAERCRTLLAALDRLTPGRRRLVELADLEGLPYGEVARRLRLPEGTVKSGLHRARAALAQVLAVSPLRPSTRP